MSVFEKRVFLGSTCSFALSWADVVQALNDITREHSNALGLGTDYHLERDLAWVVTRYHLVLHRPLHAGEVVLTTEPYSFKRMMGYRVYTLMQNGQVALEGRVQYMLINIKTKAAVLPTPFMIERFDAKYSDHRTLPFPKLKAAEHTKVKKRKAEIKKSDIDANGHVNNAAYFRYFEDVFALDQPCELSVTYKEEVFLGDHITVLKQGHQSVSIEKEGRVVFQCFKA